MQIYQQIRTALIHAKAVFEDGLAWLQRVANPRQRLGGASAVVFVLHGLVLWMLIAANPQILPERVFEEQIVDTELYTLEPPPEPLPVIRPLEGVEVEPQPQNDPKPQPDPEPVPVSQPEAFKTLPKTIIRPVETLDPVEKPAAKALADRALRADQTNTPTLDAEPDPRQVANLTVKKKDEDEEGRVEAKAALTARAPGLNDLNLHETPMPALPNISPSGLASGPVAKMPGTGAFSAGGAGAGGGLKDGRSGVSQALMNHESCVALQQAGKPIPANCNMKDLAAMKSLGIGDPAGRAHYGPVVAKKEATDRYKRTPGNVEYWNRVVRVPDSRDKMTRDSNTNGTYSNPKDQRVKEQGY